MNADATGLNQACPPATLPPAHFVEKCGTKRAPEAALGHYLPEAADQQSLNEITRRHMDYMEKRIDREKEYYKNQEEILYMQSSLVIRLVVDYLKDADFPDNVISAMVEIAEAIIEIDNGNVAEWLEPRKIGGAVVDPLRVWAVRAQMVAIMEFAKERIKRPYSATEQMLVKRYQKYQGHICRASFCIDSWRKQLRDNEKEFQRILEHGKSACTTEDHIRAQRMLRAFRNEHPVKTVAARRAYEDRHKIISEIEDEIGENSPLHIENILLERLDGYFKYLFPH